MFTIFWRKVGGKMYLDVYSYYELIPVKIARTMRITDIGL